jgi:hypothetical protein
MFKVVDYSFGTSEVRLSACSDSSPNQVAKKVKGSGSQPSLFLKW